MTKQVPVFNRKVGETRYKLIDNTTKGEKN